MFNKKKDHAQKEPVRTPETEETGKTPAPETPAEPSAEKTETPAEAPAPEDPVKELEKKLTEAELKLAEAGNDRLRLLAEMDNLRKRCSKDMEAARINTQADTLAPFLQVFDHFSMAVTAAQNSDNLKALTEGMKMIAGEFSKAFDELGVEKIDAVGKVFDPEIHEAVSQEESETVPAGTVIRQWSFGFRTPKRLIKPAMVVVSSGAPEKKETAPETAEKE